MKKSTCTFPLSQKQEIGIRQKSMAVHYGEWLNTMDWDYFCTFTTRYSLSKNAAIASMRRLKEHLLNKNGSEPIIFYAVEPFDSKYGYHLHALLKAHSEASTNVIDEIKVAWQIVTRGKFGKENKFTTILPYDSTMGGNYYVAKYLHRHNAEYGFA